MKRFQNNKNNQHKNSQSRNRNASAEEDNDQYVIVVSNVENDFAKIHQSQLVRFCSLDPSYQRDNILQRAKQHAKKGSDAEKPEDQDEDVTAVEGSEEVMHCCYRLTCRQETRTAELQVYADAANIPIAPIFTPKPQQQSPQQQQHQQQHRKRGRQEEEEEEAEGLLVQEDLRNLSSDDVGGAAAADGPSHAHNSLTSMVLQLQRKPYFNSLLNLFVTLPGYAEGDALVLQQPPADAPKDEDEEGEKAKEEEKTDSKAAKPIVRIKQFNGAQGELVSCAMQLSQGRPQGDITHLLADLPGFVSLFPHHQSNNSNNNNNNNNNNNRQNPNKVNKGPMARNYRIVFQNKKYLFQAKHLLDQFELEGNLRVYLKLNDNLVKEEEAFRLEEEEKGGLGSSHPISVIDDVNTSALPF